MTSENLLPFDPNKAADLIKQGKIKVVTTPTPSVVALPEQPMAEDKMMERAKDILGRDFLGPEAVRTMQTKLKTVGVDVEFPIDNLPPLPYGEQDLQLAKQNGEMLVLRAANKRQAKSEIPLTIVDFREFFRQDPDHKLDTPFYTFRSNANDWYPSEGFAAKPGEIQLCWTLVKKEIMKNSTDKNWSKQEDLLKDYVSDLKRKGATNTEVRRRTAMEAIWDTMLYYANTGEQLLGDKYDWTNSLASNDNRVHVGAFASDGLHVNGWLPRSSREDIGVCPSR